MGRLAHHLLLSGGERLERDEQHRRVPPSRRPATGIRPASPPVGAGRRPRRRLRIGDEGQEFGSCWAFCTSSLKFIE